ncbi:hypothetical protein E5288_WYG012359 [Bos mutus]|uniref:Uncharacterized protein n=1 Tax=Bos mutus TaxID=72004 RepID=A0A6B0RSR4_9CETA|nr:hypothetical protein [Bos mutus]
MPKTRQTCRPQGAEFRGSAMVYLPGQRCLDIPGFKPQEEPFMISTLESDMLPTRRNSLSGTSQGSGAAASSQSCETETAEEKTGPQPQQNWKVCLIKENVSLPLRPCGNDTVDVPFQKPCSFFSDFLYGTLQSSSFCLYATDQSLDTWSLSLLQLTHIHGDAPVVTNNAAVPRITICFIASQLLDINPEMYIQGKRRLDHPPAPHPAAEDLNIRPHLLLEAQAHPGEPAETPLPSQDEVCVSRHPQLRVLFLFIVTVPETLRPWIRNAKYYPIVLLLPKEEEALRGKPTVVLSASAMLFAP